MNVVFKNIPSSIRMVIDFKQQDDHDYVKIFI